MFTGIVEEIGTVRQIKKGKHSAVLTISAGDVLDGTKTGDSIAVNGICLTVTAVLPGAFMADVMHETLNRSALIGLSAGSPVNLERAMQANGRFGGHIVAGHVDGTGKIVKIERDDTAVWFTIQTKPELMRYIVESLTVAKITESDFSVSAIPHTVKQTVLQEKRKGDLVNLETDIIGKYVEKLLSPALEEQKESKITKEFLTNCGF